MKSFATGLKLFSVLLLSAGLAACDSNPLKDYVEQSVELKTSSKTSSADQVGQLVFTNTRYWTSYRHVCDTQICGYDSQYVCHTRTRCDHDLHLNSTVVASLSEFQRDHDDHGGGHGDDHGGHGGGGNGGGHGDDHGGNNGGGHGGGDDHGGPGGDDHGGHGGGDDHGGHGGDDHGHDHCETYEDCGYEQVPRYCDVNCREEPYTESSTTKTVSPVVARIRGITGSNKNAQVTGLWLGAATNAKFQQAFSDYSARPKGLESLFNLFKRSDKTLLVMQAKGLELVQGQDFLNLSSNFSRGDTIQLNVTVRETSSTSKQVSAVGTNEALPNLSTSSGD